MSWDDLGFDGVDDSYIKREKAKARDLRKSRWWQNKIGQGMCHYCRHEFKPKELTMDHMVPLARGGQSAKNNLVPCCKACNTRKKTMLPQEWEEFMEEPGQL